MCKGGPLPVDLRVKRGERGRGGRVGGLPLSQKHRFPCLCYQTTNFPLHCLIPTPLSTVTHVAVTGLARAGVCLAYMHHVRPWGDVSCFVCCVCSWLTERNIHMLLIQSLAHTLLASPPCPPNTYIHPPTHPQTHPPTFCWSVPCRSVPGLYASVVSRQAGPGRADSAPSGGRGDRGELLSE